VSWPIQKHRNSTFEGEQTGAMGSLYKRAEVIVMRSSLTHRDVVEIQTAILPDFAKGTKHVMTFQNFVSVHN